jgi:two-component system response regulator
VKSNAPDILLVEDNEDDSAFFIDALGESKPTPHLMLARDGVEALSLIFGIGDPENAIPVVLPKLIILDLNMPRMGGLETLRRLKMNRQTRLIPVVAFSSSQEASDLLKSYQLGVNSFLVKPTDAEAFGEVVRVLASYWLQFNLPPK